MSKFTMNRTPIRHQILQAMRDEKISRTKPLIGSTDTFYWIPEDGKGLGTRLRGAELRAVRELYKAGAARPGRGGPSMYHPHVMTVTSDGDQLLADWDRKAESEECTAQRETGI